MLTTLSMLLLSPPASADVMTPPDQGQRYTTHALRIEGLDQHPEFVVVVMDEGSSVSGYRSFTAEGKAQQDLARGGGRGQSIRNPTLRLMGSEAFTAWNSQANSDMFAQRAACERGEGCAHISRFEPSFTAPEGTIDCGVTLKLVTSGPEKGPDTLVDVYTLTAASAEGCTLEKTGRELLLDGEPVKASKKVQKLLDVHDGKEPEGGCATATGAGSLLAGLALVLALGRRRRQG